MGKSVCLYFQIHQPTNLRQYRFFDIGKDSHYFDDFANRTTLKRVAQNCYLPMNQLLLEEIKKHGGAFKVAFSISGSALEQFDRYTPEVLDSFRELAATGCVEFVAETYYDSLASLGSDAEFEHQVLKHKAAIKEFFGVEPKAFRNTAMIYSDSIGRKVSEMGFKTMLTEGARHIMGWRSPDHIYSCDFAEDLHLLLRNYTLSDDIAFRFTDQSWKEWPLTADKFASWVGESEGEIINIFLDYKTFGEYHSRSTGIFDFMKSLPEVVLASGNEFVTPTEASEKFAPVGELSVPEAISWADEERDVTAWLGNELQQEAFNKLYGLQEKLSILEDPILWADYGHLQESQNLHYMCTKFFTAGNIDRKNNPYDTPYEAFINFMNALSDFIIRVNDALAVK